MKDGQQVLNEWGGPIRKSLAIPFATDASFALDTVARSGGKLFGPSLIYDARPRPLLVAGPHTLSSVQQARVGDRNVLYVPPPGGDTVVERQILQYLARVSAGVVIPVPEDSAAFARRRQRAQASVVVFDDYMAATGGAVPWAAYVRSERLAGFLAAAGIDLAQARTASAPLIRELTPLGMRLLEYAPIRTGTATSPNVLGSIPGDSVLGHQAIVLTARLDQASAAEDNASGVAALLALAAAWRQPGAGPRRTIVVAAVSGSREGLWGSRYASAQGRLTGVAGLNFDGVGSDTGEVVVDGLREVTLSKPLPWMAGEHPELGLRVVEGGSVFDPTSDHFVLARRLMPVLSFRGARPAPWGRRRMRRRTRIARRAWSASRSIWARPGRPARPRS